jgi:hypothetical protein
MNTNTLNMDINMNAVSKYVVHPASVGAAAALITLAAVGNEGSIQIGSMMVSPSVAIGLSAATADLVGQAVAAYLLTLPQANKYGNAEKKLLVPAAPAPSYCEWLQGEKGRPPSNVDLGEAFHRVNGGDISPSRKDLNVAVHLHSLSESKPRINKC